MGFDRKRKQNSYAQPEDPLRSPLLSFSAHDHWALKDAFEGTLIVGTTGSGKTTGPGSTIARQFLRYGMGGLVLTAKPDEVDLWRNYCARTGRLDDLIVMEPGSGHHFNFIDFIGRTQIGPGTGLAMNVADVIYQVAQTGGHGSDQKEAFWQGEQTKIMLAPIETLLLTGDKLTPQAIYDIVVSAPPSEEKLQLQDWRDKSACYQALLRIRQRIDNGELIEDEIEDYRNLENYWFNEYCNMHEKTRGIVVSMMTSFFTEFIRRPNRTLFCTDTTITPEACFDGKIIVVNLPVRTYHKVGVMAQKMMKLMFQRTAEQASENGTVRLPGFLWCDEFQTVANDYDREFLATARSSAVASVFLTQNLPNVVEAFGGGSIGLNKTKALLANLNTKFFLANDDPVTNKYAAELIGQKVYWRKNKGSSVGDKVNFSQGENEVYDHAVRPEDFHHLRNGGPKNLYQVEAYAVQTSRLFTASGSNVLKTIFSQTK